MQADQMRRVPAFGGRFRVLPVAGAGAMLLSDEGVHVLPGSAYADVVPLVDGRRSSDEVVTTAVERGLEPATAWYVLRKLESAGYLIESRPEMDRDVGAFWSGLEVDPGEALAALRATRVRVFSVSSTAADSLGRALARCGIASSAPSLEEAGAGSERDFDIVFADDYLADALLPFDAAARSLRRRWMLVRPAGFRIWIGPLFDPGRTGCLHCLRQKLERYRSAHRFAATLDPERGTTTPLPTIAATTDLACQLAVVEAAKALARVPGDLAGAMLTVDVQDRSTRIHRLIRHPYCSACGKAPPDKAVPLQLRNHQSVVSDADGGYRTVPPEETLRKYGHLVSPITGVVETLKRVSTDKEVGHVYLAAQQARVILEPGTTLHPRRHSSAGKGITSIQAKASALGEAIERYSFERQGAEVTIPGTLNELGADAVHPNDVMNFSERQYRERRSRNLVGGSGRRFIPDPFDSDARIDWTPLWSLTERRHKLLPTDLLFARFGAAESSTEPRHCVTCSNGCAAGNTQEEAVLQGFLEIIERDAVAIWWYNRLRPPGIDLASFGDRWLSNMAAQYDHWNRDVVALDLTNDLRIPVVAAVSHLRTGPRERILVGFGCHVDVRIAAQRAVSEMSQMLVVELGLCNWLGDREYDAWIETGTRASQPHLVPDETAPVRERRDFPSPPAVDPLTSAIELCRQSVEARGLEVLVLDQTRPDVGMPVVKVVVPGLRHFWPRFGPGRLYDVPVAAGMLDAPLTESDLNPVALFI